MLTPSTSTVISLGNTVIKVVTSGEGKMQSCPSWVGPAPTGLVTYEKGERGPSEHLGTMPVKTGETPPPPPLRNHQQLERGLEQVVPAPAGDSPALPSALGALSQGGVSLF